MVEGTGLENRRGFVALREFESHFLRQILKAPFWGAFFISADPKIKNILTQSGLQFF